MTHDRPQPNPSALTERPDSEIAALRARVSASVELDRSGFPGHVARLAALRRAGLVHDAEYFQFLERLP
jgi:hypothetical protein